MSIAIRQSLLALLEERPMYGYQLRAEFEARTGSTWPLNVGQVYMTLRRLERDGLVESTGEDDEGHVFYRLTEAGRREVRRWFETPVDRTVPLRDELAIKLSCALALPGVDTRQVIQQQRAHAIRVLQDYTRLKARASHDQDVAWLLVLDSLIFQTEAEIRWLDHCEAWLARHRRQQPRSLANRAGQPALAEPPREEAAG